MQDKIIGEVAKQREGGRYPMLLYAKARFARSYFINDRGFHTSMRSF